MMGELATEVFPPDEFSSTKFEWKEVNIKQNVVIYIYLVTS